MGNLKFTVLFADDDENDIFLTRRVLLRLGVNDSARFVRNGIELMEYMAGVGKFHDRIAYPLPGLIVTDLKMPICDGFEAIGWLRRHVAFRQVQVVVMSSSSEYKDIAKARQLGVRFLTKPSDYRELQILLDTLLRDSADRHHPNAASGVAKETKSAHRRKPNYHSSDFLLRLKNRNGGLTAPSGLKDFQFIIHNKIGTPSPVLRSSNVLSNAAS